MKILTAMSEDGTFGSYHEPTMARRWLRTVPEPDSTLYREWWMPVGWRPEQASQIGLQVRIENLLSIGLWGGAEIEG